jgi:hypothetical protein
MTKGKTFKLSRYMRYPLGVVSIVRTKEGYVPLCDKCNNYFEMANVFRSGGFVLFVASVFVGGQIAFSINVVLGLIVGLILAIVGLLTVARGRRRFSQLERKVGF